MSTAQRIVLIVGATGILHSSMVPPVVQGDDEVCRYHEFVVRGWPFTRGYDVANADLAALVSEYGMILAAVALVYLLLGLFRD
jgi:hypothetical protein